MNDEHGLRVPGRAQIELERRESEVHGLVQVRVHDGRHRTRVLALASGHLMRKQHRKRAEHVLRIVIGEDLAHAKFVRRVHHRIDEHDNEGLSAGIDEVADLRAEVVLVQRNDYLSLEIDALAHDADHLDGYERIRPIGVGDVLLATHRQSFAIPTAAAQGHCGFEPCRGEQPQPRSLAFE
jgi:hypothetical protein